MRIYENIPFMDRKYSRKNISHIIERWPNTVEITGVRDTHVKHHWRKYMFVFALHHILLDFVI